MHDPLIRNRKSSITYTGRIITHFPSYRISGHDSYSSLIATRSRICTSCLVSIHEVQINNRSMYFDSNKRSRSNSTNSKILIKNRERRNPRKLHRQSSRILPVHNFGLLHWIIAFVAGHFLTPFCYKFR